MTGISACFQLDWPGFALDVDLELPGRGVTALFGHSGFGNIALLHCIVVPERSPQGHPLIDGKVWQDVDRWMPSPATDRLRVAEG